MMENVKAVVLMALVIIGFAAVCFSTYQTTGWAMELYEDHTGYHSNMELLELVRRTMVDLHPELLETAEVTEAAILPVPEEDNDGQ